MNSRKKYIPTQQSEFSLFLLNTRTKAYNTQLRLYYFLHASHIMPVYAVLLQINSNTTYISPFHLPIFRRCVRFICISFTSIFQTAALNSQGFELQSPYDLVAGIFPIKFLHRIVSYKLIISFCVLA